MLIYKEILDPITKRHLRFDLVDSDTDRDLVAVRETALAMEAKRQAARENLKAIKAKGKANWTTDDLKEFLEQWFIIGNIE